MNRALHLGGVRWPAETAARPTSVSVVIPCFNYARYLPESIGSALDQHGVDVNVIVVDDASTDDSVIVAQEYAARDSRVTVLMNEENRGPVDTFNRGLRHARGEFLVRLDADDLLTPGSLSRAVALMQAHPNVGMTYGHPVHFVMDRPPARDRARGWVVWSGHDWLRARCLAGSNVITSPEVVMRRSVVAITGGQRDLAHTHDMEMWLRLSAHADVGYVEGADQAWHRDHPASLSTKAEDPLHILSEIRDAFDVLFAGVELPEGEAEQMHANARRAVALQALAYARRDYDRGVGSAAADALKGFAYALDPEVAFSSRGRRTEASRLRAAALPRRLGWLLGLAPRLCRRVQGRLAASRWVKTGLYEPSVVRNASDESRSGGT